jgi:PAS domain S-box-containing protein
MTYVYTPYIWPFIGTIIMNLLMITHIFKKRRMDGATEFIITLFCCSLWCVGTIMETSATDLRAKLFWAKISCPAHVFATLTWFVMTFKVTDWRYWINRKRLLWLSVIPVITVILALTNDYHGWIWQSVSLRAMGQLRLLVTRYGLWFWVYAVYCYGLDLISFWMMLFFWRHNAPHYGKQFGCLAFSMGFVMLVNMAYTLGFGVNIDPTPIAWGISSPFITWVLFRDKLFDLMPIARNRVMESMTEGIVVMDLKNRIADLNPAAKEMLHCQTKQSIGRDAGDFFAGWPALQDLFSEDGKGTQFECAVHQEDRYYQASGLPIKNERGNLLGKLLIIRDVTDRKLTERQLSQKQQEIAVQKERERMARDLHDNLSQILGFVNVQTQAVREYLKRDQLPAALQCLARLTEVAQQAHDAVRTRIIAMHGDKGTDVKKDIDFIKELEELIRLFKKSSTISFEIDSACMAGLEHYGSQAAVQILSIIKESFNNIIKHSRASIVKLTLQEDREQGLSIVLMDNGCGFDVAGFTANRRGKYGLRFMKERVAELGGSLNVDSGPGKGTTIKIHIPRQLRKGESTEDAR